MARARNVLILCVDEMRADHLGCAGNPIVRTPNLDRLASRGTRFVNACCNNPICQPARATMFTGMLPRDHGLRINGLSLRPDLRTLPSALAAAGYRTHAAGKLHLTPWVTAGDPPDPALYPEAMGCWTRGLTDRLPCPYYGLQSVDFVGGHVGWVYGMYLPWLRERGGDPALLGPSRTLRPLTGAPSCYHMALPEELHYNRYVADSAVRIIEEGGADGRPFFIWCSFPDPHLPFAPPRPYGDLYDPSDMPLPARRDGEFDRLPPVYRDVLAGRVRPNGIENIGITDAHWQEMLALTYGMITHVDAEVGRVLAALERTGRDRDTLVVFLSDHGDMQGDHGLFCKAFYTFAGCIRIPLIVADPGAPGGRASEALVSQVDLLPSVLDAVGVDMPGSDWTRHPTPFQRGRVLPLRTHPGSSWRGIVEGTASALHDAVVIENDDPTTGFQVRTLVTRDYRLSVYPGTPDGELFDLRRDPQELNNLWYAPPMREVRHALVGRLLDEYSRQTPWHPVPPGNA